MLENQIYSIESANINQETLNAMKNAGKAMKDIHGNLSIDKVDQIMYVPIAVPTLHLFKIGLVIRLFFSNWCDLHIVPGRTLLSKRLSQTKLVPQSPAGRRPASRSTKQNWTQTWPNSNRRRWTKKCSRQGQCQFCPAQRTARVSIHDPVSIKYH